MSRNSPGQRLRDRIAARKEQKAEAERRIAHARLIATRKNYKRSTYVVLNQTEWWYDFENDAHRIPSMSIRYKRNLLRWLEKRANHLRVSYMWAMPAPNLNGEMAQIDAEREYFNEQDRIAGMDALEWLWTTPLYNAIQESVARGEDGPDGEEPGKMERYVRFQQQHYEDLLAAAEDATWD